MGALAGTLVSAGTGLLTSILGLKSQNSANKTNMKIAQMNNEWSERMMDKQHMYDVEMWNKNNEYNDPAKQVERLKGAGINPALALGSIGTGQASGGSSVSLPSPSRAEVKPLNYEGFSNAINNSIQMFMALSRNNAEIGALDKRIDNETALARARIAEMYEETRSKKFHNELNDITRDLQIQNQQEDFLRKVQERSNMEEQNKLVKQQIIAQQLLNANLPERLSLELAVMASQRHLNSKNAKHEIGQIIDTLESRGYKLSKSEKERIFKAVIQDIETQQYRGLNATNTLVGLLNR